MEVAALGPSAVGRQSQGLKRPAAATPTQDEPVRGEHASDADNEGPPQFDAKSRNRPYNDTYKSTVARGVRQGIPKAEAQRLACETAKAATKKTMLRTRATTES